MKTPTLTLSLLCLHLASAGRAGILDPALPALYRTNSSPAALVNALNLTTNGGSYRGEGGGLSNLSAFNITGLGGLIATNYTYATNQATGVMAAGRSAFGAFSSWCMPVGVVTNPFCSLVASVVPYTSSPPSNLRCVVRVQGPFTNANGYGLSGAMSPSSWVSLADVTQPVSLAAGTTNYVRFSLPGYVSSASNLTFELRGDGYFGMQSVSGCPVTNEATYVRCSYQANRVLTTGDWNETYSALPNYVGWVGFERQSGTNTGLAVVSDAFGLRYSNAVSGLAAVTVQGALDEVASNRVALWVAPAAVICLPATNYAVEGIEMNLYYENVIRHNYGLGNYWVNATATNGSANAGFYRLVPTAGMAGNMPLSLQVSFATNVLATWSGVVRCVAATNGTGLTNAVCLIGDSTTAGGQVVAGLYSDADTNGYKLRFVGTQGTAPQQQEGRSGWTLGGFYAGAGSPMTNGAGAFDFNFYLTNNGLVLRSNDWVLVNLGINDLSWQLSDASALSAIVSFTNTFTAMASNIFGAVPGIRVGLCVTIPPSADRAGWATSYGATMGYERCLRNRYLLAEALCGYAWSNVVVVPIHAALDTVNGFPVVTEAVSSHNTNLWTHASNGVHPSTLGYLQIADALWAFLKGNAR